MTWPAAAQNDGAADDFHIYRDPPRIALTAQRLRLLERERERASLRWEAFDALMSGGARMPEPGFASALYYRVAKNPAAGRQAVDWALGEGADLRQLALVFDWCGPVRTAAESDRLAAKIQAALARPASDIPGQSARVLAAIAIADRLPDAGDAILREIVLWWRARAPSSVPREHLYPLFEMLHAMRDNTQVELRESSREYFRDLPLSLLAAHYPAPFPTAENDFRIPIYVSEREPDVRDATLSRAAAFAMVAYDTNALNNQYVQGWLMNDRFLMRGPLGVPYEFLWANPYQPGLSFRTLPLVFHDAGAGQVFARTSWEEDATWIGYYDGRLQMFQDGQIQTLRAGAAVAPVRVGAAVIASATSPETARLRIDTESLFVLGLTPRAEYGVEIDDQELDFLRTDAGGTLVIEAPEGIDAGVRLRKRPASAP